MLKSEVLPALQTAVKRGLLVETTYMGKPAYIVTSKGDKDAGCDALLQDALDYKLLELPGDDYYSESNSLFVLTAQPEAPAAEPPVDDPILDLMDATRAMSDAAQAVARLREQGAADDAIRAGETLYLQAEIVALEAMQEVHRQTMRLYRAGGSHVRP